MIAIQGVRSGQGTAKGWQQNVLALSPAFFAALLVWRHALDTFFTSDDLVALARAAGLEVTPLLVRPLSAVLAARAQYAVFGLSPLGYHVVNLALHLVAAGGVYAITLQVLGVRGPAAAAAVLFAGAGIAFTPLHAASGIGDLLCCVLLEAATLLYLNGLRRKDIGMLWIAAAAALLAALAKEHAVAWPLVAIALVWREGGSAAKWRLMMPALIVGIVIILWLVGPARILQVDPTGPYALDISAGHVLTNLTTYLHWSVAVGAPFRDRVAMSDPASRPIGIAVALAALLAMWWERKTPHHPVQIGVTWWVAFVLPVVALSHHTYLYYLYTPWAGGAIALVAAGNAIAQSGFVKRARGSSLVGAVAAGGLTAFVLIEAQGVGDRENAKLDALPLDPTLRQATLLGHALPTLRAAALPYGTAVGFVNPVPRASVGVPVRSPILGGNIVQRTQYIPLEVAFGNGKSLQLFAPGTVDSGFATTVPAGWEGVECFLYEQRGWLRQWGRGQGALMRQAELQAAKEQWAAAESSFARVRSLGDTVPAAMCGEAVARIRLGRLKEGTALADTFSQRWPGDKRTLLLSKVTRTEPVDPRLIRPFDERLRLVP